jgi:putative glutamine amidotransferase
MKIANKPLIAIVLDENTSTGGANYDTGKGYFRAIEQAGGVAVGLPYARDSLIFALSACDGLMSTGARIAFPVEWYIEGEHSPAPQSERFAIERALVEAFLEHDKPYLGICNGMQLLSCLSGCRMSGNAKAHADPAYTPPIAHDDRESRHPVSVVAGTRLEAITGTTSLTVNSFHREAVIIPSTSVTVSAYAPDGLIEAIERPDKAFALGVQWHPERLLDESADARALFSAFVDACR